MLRFWRVPVQILGEVLEGSGADLLRLWRVPVQIACAVPESFRADTAIHCYDVKSC